MDLSQLSGGKGYRNKVQITSSQNFTVPQEVYQVDIKLTAAGAAGGGCGLSSKVEGAGGGSAGSSSWVRNLPVVPGDILTFIIGSKGLGVAGQAGQDGGNTVVYKNFLPLARALGGKGGTVGAAAGNGGVNADIAGNWSVTGDVAFIGGDGGNGGTAITAPSGKIVSIKSSISAPSSVFSTLFPEIAVNNGGIRAGSPFYGGGGGGCSEFGKGGNGGNGPISGTRATQGGDATEPGAGGGGASGGSDASVQVRGGHGANGIGEVYY